MKNLSQSIFLVFLTILIFIQGYLLIDQGTAPVYGTTENLDFDVSANCSPHVDIESYDALTIRFVSKSLREGPQMTAFLYAPQFPTESSLNQKWDFPLKQWHSVLFEGLPVTARFYCQESEETKDLHLSYYKDQEVKISLSQEATLSSRELDAINMAGKRSFIAVHADSSKKEVYTAGKGTEHPYWLTFSIPVHSPHEIKTQLQYEFQ